MELAVISGRGPEILTNIDGLKPLVRDEDIVVFGYRDAEQSSSYGSQDVKDTNMHVFDLLRVRELKIGRQLHGGYKAHERRIEWILDSS